MRILSIDWDYFIDATDSERTDLFPDCHTELPVGLAAAVWKNRYAIYKEKLYNIPVKPLNFIETFLKESYIPSIHVAESHKELYNLVPCSGAEIVNIDFHHDFSDKGSYVHCGNWLRHLYDEKRVREALWIKDERSHLQSDFPFEVTTDLTSIAGRTFDLLFFCRSSVWSPPHLNTYYIKLIKECLK